MSAMGFTGTQEGMTISQARKFWKYLRDSECEEFHHGDCIGADETAHYIARSLGLWIVGHPPTNPKKRAYCDCDEWREPLPYLDRNKEIVKESEAMAATPKEREEQQRSGTWATIRESRRRHRPINIIFP